MVLTLFFEVAEATTLPDRTAAGVAQFMYSVSIYTSLIIAERRICIDMFLFNCVNLSNSACVDLDVPRLPGDHRSRKGIFNEVTQNQYKITNSTSVN